LTEHEFDHVMIGYYDEIRYKSRRSWSLKWMAIDDVKDDMQAHPEIYTVWFKIILTNFIFLEDHKI
jgi:isopentenyl-diphosphate delta-isomerase